MTTRQDGSGNYSEVVESCKVDGLIYTFFYFPSEDRQGVYWFIELQHTRTCIRTGGLLVLPFKCIRKWALTSTMFFTTFVIFGMRSATNARNTAFMRTCAYNVTTITSKMGQIRLHEKQGFP